MPHVDNHQVESPETSVTSRRRLLSALVAGGAFATAAPLLAGRASAAEGGSSSPARDPQDNNALNNALAREARMVGTYRLAAAAVSADDEVAGLTLILDHHIAYVHAIKGYLDQMRKTRLRLHCRTLRFIEGNGSRISSD